MSTEPASDALMVHESCAEAVPETWVTLIGGQKYVCGVDKIVKDRWTLKCSLCTKSASRLHGAKIQCAKGRCSKAFHVSCARNDPDVEYTVGDGEVPKETSEGVLLKKPVVTALCPQHNPRLVEARKADKQQKLDADIGALKQYARIKVRASGGVFAVTLVNVYEDRRTVEVIWDQGSTKEFKYTSVVWTDDAEVQEKPGKSGENATLGSDLIGSYPSPAPTLRDPHSPNVAPTALKPAVTPLEATKSACDTPNPPNSQPKYSFQPYRYYSYPPPYPGGPAPPPQAYQPPQPHAGYTVPMPVPIQYPYSYPAYGQQHGYPPQPQFYPAHGYHYPPMTTFHPAVPLPPSQSTHSNGNSATASPASASVPLPGGSFTSNSSAMAPKPSAQSYVGVRPASSRDILNGTHQARPTARA